MHIPLVQSSSTAADHGPEVSRPSEAVLLPAAERASSPEHLGCAAKAAAPDLLFLLPGWSANVARHLGGDIAGGRAAGPALLGGPLAALGRSAAGQLFLDALALTVTSLTLLAEGLGSGSQPCEEIRYASLLSWYDVTRTMCRARGVRASIPAPLSLRQDKLAAFDGALLFSSPRLGRLGILGHAALRGWCAALVANLGTSFAGAAPLLCTSRGMLTRVFQDVEHLTQSSTLATAHGLRCASHWGPEEEAAFRKVAAWSSFRDTLSAFSLQGLGLCAAVQRDFDEALACAVLARYVGLVH